MNRVQRDFRIDLIDSAATIEEAIRLYFLQKIEDENGGGEEEPEEEPVVPDPEEEEEPAK